MSQAAGLWCDLTKRSARSTQTATLWNWLCTRLCVCEEENIEWQKQINVSSLNIDQCSNLSTLQQHLGNGSSLILCVHWQKRALRLWAVRLFRLFWSCMIYQTRVQWALWSRPSPLESKQRCILKIVDECSANRGQIYIQCKIRHLPL